MSRSPRRKPLPPLVAEFIEMLATTHKPNTCDGHGRRLRRFHQWLDDNRLDLGELRRVHMTKWFVHLKRCGTQAGDRVSAMVVVRMYLRWLFETGAIETSPEHLVRRSDIPRLPSYLPRPLQPDADHELQKRLRQSPSLFHQGLLLMRKTGIRVGELRDLEYDCLRADFDGHLFLKVPLGKLDNERLVPLDDSAVTLVRAIQQRGRIPRPWLLASVWGKKSWPKLYEKALNEISAGLDPLQNITPHRLRHTYATSILNGGMSLVGVMKLLGHHSLRMTLRYAEITQETVVKEYYEALTQIEQTYQLKQSVLPGHDFDPTQALADVIRWLEKHCDRNHSARLLIRRLTRATEDVLAYTNT